MPQLIRFALAIALLSAASPTEAAQRKFTFAYVTDPTHEVYFYALRHGQVKSDTLDLELNTLSIPALTQALLGRQYDAIQASVVALPRALGQGLKVNILHAVIGRASDFPSMDIWVRKDSPIQSIDDLKGRQIATFGITSSSTAMVRLALSKDRGFNVSLQGGDFQFVELPATAIPAALETNRIPAAQLLYAQVYMAQKSGEFRSIYSAAKVLQRLSGARMVLPVIVGFTDQIAADEAAYAEFIRMIAASIRYAAAHSKEIVAEIGQQTNAPPEYLQNMVDSVGQFASSVEEQDITAINYFWQAAKSIGMLDAAPDVRPIVWPRALRP